MNMAAYLRSLVRRMFGRAALAEEIADELRSHIEHRADDLERGGMSRSAAERQARVEMGARERFGAECNEAAGGTGIDTLLSDVRFAARVLRKSPGFTVAAITTLALAIGANAVVFGVMNALVLHPIDVPNAKGMYSLGYRVDDNFESYANYLDLQAHTRSFDGMAALQLAQVAVDTGKDPSRLWGFEASGNYFDMVGVQPYLGRFFHASDEKGLNSAPTMVLTYSYWQREFGGDRNVIGRVVRVNRHPFTVIGIAPPDFRGTFIFFAPCFYLPIVNDDQIVGESRLMKRGNRSLIQVLLHLRPGVSEAQAVADLDGVGATLARAYPDVDGGEKFALQTPGFPGILGRPVRAFVGALTLLAGLILLGACANLGSLFAARASDRSREIALRLALGSSRVRVLRQLLTEALLVGLAGGAVGLAGSIALLRRLEAWQPFSTVPIHVPVRPDWHVYLVALLLAVVSALLFGIVPARQVFGASPYELMKKGSGDARRGRVKLRDVLLVAQIAICAVLVTSSIVAVRGLERSMHSNFGVEPKDVMLLDTDLKMSGYTPEQIKPMQRRMLEALQAIPGVDHAAVVSFPPLGRGGSWKTDVFRDEARDFRPSNVAASSWMYVISPDYFAAAGTTLLQGRGFTEHDDGKAPSVAIVNREFAAKIFGTADGAVGRFYRAKDGTRLQVVGVVADGKYLSITEDQQPALYVPALQQDALGQQWFVVRSRRDPEQLAAAMRMRLHALDAGLPLDILPWTRELDFSLFSARMAALSLGVLGAMGAMLSITGIFGMAAYSVSKRLRELGIRVALGAQRREVLQTAVGRCFKLLAFGSVLGLGLGVLSTRVLAYVVYEATPRDPLVLIGSIAAMLLLGVVASWIPAQRALSIDPLVLLRDE